MGPVRGRRGRVMRRLTGAVSRHPRVTPPAPRLLAAVPGVVLAACAAALLLAGCGTAASGTGADGDGAVSPTPTPVPSPFITEGVPPAGAVEVVRAFWSLVGAGRLAEAQRSLVAPGAPLRQWTGDDIAGARFVRLVPGSTGAAPPDGATVEFAAEVWIEPAAEASPWGEAGTHELFESVVRMSDGTWRMVESGTGP